MAKLTVAQLTATIEALRAENDTLRMQLAQVNAAKPAARTVQRPAYQPEPWQVARAEAMRIAKAAAMSGKTTVKVQA
jgi:hypothetical protein